MKDRKQWFPHDVHASRSPKLIAMELKLGIAGYGRFWAMIELFRSQQDYKFNITTKYANAVLCKLLRFTPAKLQAYLKAMIEDFDLFQTDGTYIWSNGLNRRMKYWDDRYESLRDRGRKGAEARIRSLRTKGEDNGQEAA